MNQSDHVLTKTKCHDLWHHPSIGHTIPSTEERHFMNDTKLSIPQAARAIGISSNSVRRLIADGRLPVLRILKKTLILATDIEKLLKDSHCFVKAVKQSNNRLPPLPAEVINSPHLRIGGKI